MKRFTGAVAALLSTTCLMTATSVYAQSNDGFSEDVVVTTATRRASDIQDVPIAVTAIKPEALNRQGVVNVQNLTSVAPSFSVSNAQIASGSVVLRIRGVGTTSNNIGFESAVGIFVDGAYQSRPGVALGEFVDVESVEVLRGPQGTLFGRNTSAGALNITNVAPDPTEFGGFANATYGNYNLKNLQGAVNIPVVDDKVAIRLTGAYRERDGYIDIQNAAGQKIGESNSIDQYMLRGQVGFENEGGLEGRVIVDYSKSDNVCCAAIEVLQSGVETAGIFGAVGLGPRGGMSGPIVATDPNDMGTAEAAAESLIASSSQVPNPSADQIGITGEFNYPLTDTTDLVYIGSYREYDAAEQYDSAFSGLDLFNVLDNDTNIDTMTHELRVQGEAMDGRLDWLVGAYYSEEDISQLTSFGLGTDYSAFADALLIAGTGGLYPNATILSLGGALPVASGGLNPATARTSNLYTQDSTSFSVFTHNIFDVTDDLSVTVGLRYSDESKDGSFSQPTANYASCEAQLGNFDLATGSFPPAPGLLTGNLVVLGCFPFLAPADQPLSAALPLPRTFDETFKDDELIYTGKLAYKFAPQASGYASFTHGYKSGGFNLDSTAAIGGADPSFASEIVDAYEVGLKTKLWDNRVTLNVAAFIEKFENFQVLEFTGAQFQTFNVPKAQTKGVEIETVANFTDNLTFNGGLTLLNAKYPDDCDKGREDVANVATLCGNTLTNAPKTVGIAGLSYANDFNDDLKFFVNGQLRYEGDRRTSTQAFTVPNAAAITAAGSLGAAISAASPVPFDVQEANTKINMRVGLGDQDDKWMFELWGTNITDVVTRGVTFNTTLRSGSRSAFVQDPATYGATIRTTF